MDIKNIVIGGLVGLVVLLGGLTFMGHTAVQNEQPLGALPGPILNYPYFGVGGTLTYYTGTPLKTATSTLCYTISPGATTTVQASQLRMDISSSSALTLKFGYGSVLGTIATQIGTSYTIGANTQAFVQASTTPTTGASTVIPPKSYVMWTINNGGPSDAETGTCQIELLSS